MKTSRIVFLAVLLAAFCGGAVYAAMHTYQSQAAQPASLAAYAPPGAVLAIESADFASLLKSWNNSPEQKRWLASANYAGFANSRLFGDLSAAQDEFATSAGLPPDADFLQQVAGTQSIFAWYDISKLQFLYITKLPTGSAAKTPLLGLRNNFEQRKVGVDTFYVRTQGPKEGDTGIARTVAFAVRGDYLLLATREDLLAGALQLMQQPSDHTLLQDAFYAGAGAVANKQPGDLRMTLDLSKIVPSGYFRSYWVQQNSTALKQYSASLSDLYRTPTAFREERVLLAADPTKDLAAPTDLAPVLDYVPAGLGVYRATSQPATAEVLTQLQDKLLSRQTSAYRNAHIAPVADLSMPSTGDGSNFDQRIDEPQIAAQPLTAALVPLQTLLNTSPPAAMLTFSTATSAAASPAAFTPIRTAVVLTTATAWNLNALQQALTSALAPRISIGNAGLTWTQHHNATATWTILSGNATLALAIQGKALLLASDEPTLLQLLAANNAATHTPRLANNIAGFDHHAEQAPLLALTKVLDHTTAPPAPGVTPPFFSGNILSLSQTFQSLDSETFTESATPDHITHQTVLYQWHQ